MWRVIYFNYLSIVTFGLTCTGSLSAADDPISSTTAKNGELPREVLTLLDKWTKQREDLKCCVIELRYLRLNTPDGKALVDAETFKGYLTDGVMPIAESQSGEWIEEVEQYLRQIADVELLNLWAKDLRVIQSGTSLRNMSTDNRSQPPEIIDRARLDGRELEFDSRIHQATERAKSNLQMIAAEHIRVIPRSNTVDALNFVSLEKLTSSKSQLRLLRSETTFDSETYRLEKFLSFAQKSGLPTVLIMLSTSDVESNGISFPKCSLRANFGRNGGEACISSLEAYLVKAVQANIPLEKNAFEIAVPAGATVVKMLPDLRSAEFAQRTDEPASDLNEAVQRISVELAEKESRESQIQAFERPLDESAFGSVLIWVNGLALVVVGIVLFFRRRR